MGAGETNKRPRPIGTASEKVEKICQITSLRSEGGLAYSAPPRAKSYPRRQTQGEGEGALSPCAWCRGCCDLARGEAVYATIGHRQSQGFTLWDIYMASEHFIRDDLDVTGPPQKRASKQTDKQNNTERIVPHLARSFVRLFVCSFVCVFVCF